MRTPAQDLANLTALNHHYVRSVDQSDTAWFEQKIGRAHV